MTILGTMSMVPRNLQTQSPVCIYRPRLMRLPWLKVCRGESDGWSQSVSNGSATQLVSHSRKFCIVTSGPLHFFVEVAFLSAT